MPQPPRYRKEGNLVTITFRHPPPGASAETRVAAYGDALLATEAALNSFKDELARHTEELIVRHNLAEKEREQTDGRFGHIELMLVAVMRALSLDPKTGQPMLPAMRDKMVTADEIESAVERGVESAIERKTPAAAFPPLGFNPWHPPPPPTGITSERAKEIVENVSNKDEKNKLVEREKARGDMYRNIVVGSVSAAGGAGLLGLIYLIAKAIMGAR
jgi:hypothetical protein